MVAVLSIIAILMVGVVVALVLSHFVLKAKPIADEVYAVTTEDGWKLRLFRHLPREGGQGEPVLLCPGVVANHWEFELPSAGSLVDALTQAGYDCWILDPRGRRSSRPAIGQSYDDVAMDDWLNQDLPAAIDYVRVATRYDYVHYVGHSMGGMLLYAFNAAFGQDKIASGTTLASPVGFEGLGKRNYGPVVKALRLRSQVEYIVRALAPLAMLFKLQASFLPINWSNLSPKVGARALYNMLELPSHRVGAELEFWVRQEIWRMNNDELDVAASLAEFDLPLLAIYAAADPLVPIHRARAFFEAIPHQDKRMIVLSRENGHSADYNHIDLVMGKRSWDEVYQPIIDWLREHPITARIGVVRGQQRADAITTVDAIRERLENQGGRAQSASHVDTAGEEDEEAASPHDLRLASRRNIEPEEPDEFTQVERRIIVEQEPEVAEHTGPILPGAAMDELARLAREVRDAEKGGGERPFSTPSSRSSAPRKAKVPAKKPSVRKADAESKVKPNPKPRTKAAPKKPTTKRKPKSKE